MFIRSLLCILLLLPSFAFASNFTSECTIGSFILSLSDYGIKKDHKAVNRSVGNHNSAMILDFIKDVLIQNQNYSLQEQKFTLVNFNNKVEIEAYFITDNNTQLKPFIFNSEHSNCKFKHESLVCNSGNPNYTQLKINFIDKYNGIIRAYSHNGASILAKHRFSCH